LICYFGTLAVAWWVAELSAVLYGCTAYLVPVLAATARRIKIR
jgi:hypothetical protein